MKHILIFLLLLILLVAVKFCNAQQYTIFGSSAPQNNTTTNYGAATDFGTKFKSNISGFILGVRFYKTTGNSGTHIGELYSSSGTRLAQATFTNESSGGWQTVMFTTPVSIIGGNGTFYIASYWSSLGNCADKPMQFQNPIINGPLVGLAYNSIALFFNGCYSQANVPEFPTSGTTDGFWVDPIFSTSLPLPVLYLYFDVTKKNLSADLKWATANEQNNSGFSIERSVDGSNWETISFVTGFGNSTTEKDYEYLDENLTGGTYYYRLIQIDYDGKTTYSKVDAVTISTEPVLELMQNFPNPFNVSTTVSISIPKATHVQLFLYDAMGRRIRILIDEERMAGQYDVQVNKNGLMAGIYYCKLSALSQSLIRKLLVY